MAEYTIIQVKRDSTLNWYASNPRLALGEPGVDTDLHRFKIGNGIDRWNELPYMDDDLYKLLDEQQQQTADYVQDLLNLIAENKLDADQKHNAVTSELRNTSRTLNERMSAVETGQQQYQENLTERQKEYEEALTGDFEDTKAEVQAGLDEFNETRDSLNIRMNVIAGQATEDTEILDARVDAEDYTHPNLGENIRNIHTLLKETIQTSSQTKAGHDTEIAGLKAADEEETQARVAADEAEMQARVSADEAEEAARIAADEAEKAERTAGHEEHKAELLRLDDSAEKLSVHDEFLQEQIDTNAEGILRTGQLLSGEMLRTREEFARVDSERNAEQQARADADSEIQQALEAEKIARVIADDTLSESIRAVESSVNSRLDEEANTREQSDSALGERIDSESERINQRITQNELGIQANAETIRANAEETQEAIDSEREARILADDEHSEREELLAENIESNIAQTRETLSARDDYLQEQAGELAGLVLEEIYARREDTRNLKESLLSETADRLESEAELHQEIARIDEIHTANEAEIHEELGEEIARVDEAFSEGIQAVRNSASIGTAHVQEQTDEIASEVIGLNLGLYAEQKARKYENAELSARLADERIMREDEDRALREVIRLQDEALRAEDEGIREDLRREGETRSGEIQELGGRIEQEGIKLRNETGERLEGLSEIHSRREEFLQEQADDIAGEVLSLNLKLRSEQQTREHEDAELSAKLSTLSENTDRQIEQQRQDFAAAIEQQKQDFTAANEGLSTIHSRREDFIQEQTDEISSLVLEQALNSYELRGKLNSEESIRAEADTALGENIRELEESLAGERDDRQEEYSQLQGHIDHEERLNAIRHEHYTEQLNENAELNIQQALDLRQEQAQRHSEIQETNQRIDQETQERVSADEQIRSQTATDIEHEAGLRAAADETVAKIRADNDAGLQEQINDLAALKLNEALTIYRKNLQAKTDKYHEDTVNQEINQKCNDQINTLVEAVLCGLLIGYRAREKIKARIKGLEDAMIEAGILDDTYIPPTTDAEIETMIEGIFSGNISGNEIVPDDEDDAEFLQDLYNIFNP